MDTDRSKILKTRFSTPGLNRAPSIGHGDACACLQLQSANYGVRNNYNIGIRCDQCYIYFSILVCIIRRAHYLLIHLSPLCPNGKSKPKSVASFSCFKLFGTNRSPELLQSDFQCFLNGLWWHRGLRHDHYVLMGGVRSKMLSNLTLALRDLSNEMSHAIFCDNERHR